jgi:hypothetical protein
MALGFYFSPKSFSKEQYDETIKRLDAAGAGSPAGRRYHFAFPGEGGLNVFDIWDSQESFDKFGETLIPIMTEIGSDPGEPTVVEIHNMIIG